MFLKLKCWFIRKLIGDMPVIINCKIFDEDFDVNFGTRYINKQPFMFYSNDVKKLSWIIDKAIVRSHISDSAVIKTYNDKYVLNPTRL